MEYRNLGRSGLRVSVLGLGCNDYGGRWGVEKSRSLVHHALDVGINLLDTADWYPSPAAGVGPPGRSEECLGEALEGRRHEALIGTKFAGPPPGQPLWRGGSRRAIMESVEGSLRRLRTDYIDLYQMHNPDPTTPIEETLSALDDLIRGGKVRYIGCSNFSGWQVADAAWTARTHHQTPFVSAENEYSLLRREIERELAPACVQFGLGIIPYFPLASGLLTGKYRRDAAPPEGTRFAMASHLPGMFGSERNFDLVERLMTVADRRGRSLAELAIAWLLARPAVSSVIAGASTTDQIDQNVRGSLWQLGDDDLQEIDAALEE